MLTPVFPVISAGLLQIAQTDPDLNAVRGDPRFQEMLAAAEARLAAGDAAESPSP
jgi:hypothetical protein